MIRRRLTPCIRLFSSLALALAASAALAANPLPFDVPEGFTVTRVADDALAHDIFSITCDPAGAAVVSGPGYIRRLVDKDGDGTAESAQQIAALPASGAQGLCFDGTQLWFTGDGIVGRLTDANGDGVSDGPPETLAQLRSPEHGAHALVKGPDGWIYALCGNDSGVAAEHVTSPASPIAQPTSGALLRFSPDGKQCQALAHGFRNPYDFDFTVTGRIITVDSDGERAHHLPWYAPTRAFDVAIGMHHGWLEHGWMVSWSRPEWFSDNVPRAAQMGRGSPSGLVVYRHRQFPERYRGGAFSACWTLGKIFYLALERVGSQVVAKPETFFATQGNVGFAPVDLVVSPEGDLLVAIGGRRTSGGVFRIRHEKGLRAVAAKPAGSSELEQVLQADQPLESWSRARWAPLARKLGPAALAEAASNAEAPAVERLRALEALVETADGVSEELAATLADDADPIIRTRLAWALAGSPGNPSAAEVLAKLTADAEPAVCRAAWEALLTVEPAKLADPTIAAWSAGGEAEDRRIRQLVVTAARRLRPADPASLLRTEGETATPRQVLAQLWASDPLAGKPGARTPEWAALCWQRGLTVLEKDPSPAVRLEAVRLLQLALGDLGAGEGKQAEHEAGYTARAVESVDAAARAQAAQLIAAAFPTDDSALNQELARLAAMLDTPSPELLPKLATRWTADSAPADDVHYLIVASRITGPRPETFTAQTAAALCQLHAKLRRQKLHLSRTWPLHVGQTFMQLVERDERLPAALAADAQFGLPEHSLFAARLSGEPAVAAAQKLLERCQQEELAETDWHGELVGVLARVPEGGALPLLRERFDAGVARESIVTVLARDPRIEDRARLAAGLDLLPPESVRQAAKALSLLGEPGNAEEVTAAIRALRRFSAPLPRGGAAVDDPEVRRTAQQFRPTIDALAYLLVGWTGGSADRRVPDDAPVDQVAALCDRWYAWFLKRYPEEARKLTGLASDGSAKWRDRLREIRWDDGDAARGKLVFEKQNCHRCHLGNSRLGPELTGVAARLSREDLLAAIVDPNREVSPLYRAKLLATRSGQVYHGLVVYESPEGTLMQTGVDTTIRVGSDDFLELADSPQSLMPTGLLDAASNEDVADLMAYLDTLKPAAAEPAPAAQAAGDSGK